MDINNSMKVIETKKPTSFDEQLEILKNHGCIIGDENWAKDVLKQINYYRFTAYFLPYKKADGTYKDGTTFSNVYSTYEFDRKLRQLLLAVMEEIEIMLRSQISYYHAHTYGALGYEDEKNYNNRHNHSNFVKKIEDSIKNNRNHPIVKHHNEKYGGKFPIWVIIELFTIGQLSFFYSDLLRKDKKAIAKEIYKTTDTNMENWLMCLTDLRNKCAHYSRLYYAMMNPIPVTPKGFSYVLNRTTFDYILVLKFLYYDKIKWQNIFLIQLEALIEEYSPSIELEKIGFPENWKELLRQSNPTAY